VESRALADSVQTRLGRQLESATRAHGGDSGFRLLSLGVDAYLIRMQMIDAAERTLDLQYSIFRGDDSGRLLTEAALHAADRGVRSCWTMGNGRRRRADCSLTAHRGIEIRFYNPFAYRGHLKVLKGTEYLFNRSRLNYRMHNKLMVADNAVALIGGRNIGDQYFQIDAEEQYADTEVFAVGPIVRRLSASFDEYWNHPLSIPNEALSAGRSSRSALSEHRESTVADPAEVSADGVDFASRVDSGEPFAGMLSGRCRWLGPRFR
jgi:putative cardiolipin synthase